MPGLLKSSLDAGTGEVSCPANDLPCFSLSETFPNVLPSQLSPEWIQSALSRLGNSAD